MELVMTTFARSSRCP